MVRLVVKNGHQKDTSYDAIGHCAQNTFCIEHIYFKSIFF